MIALLATSLRRGAGVGFRAGRENLFPALCIQLVMLLTVVGYYLHWPSTAILTTLAAMKAKGGHLFTFVASGLCAGVLAEAFRVLFLDRGRFGLKNVEAMAFRFVLIGLGGVGADYVYLFLGATLGTEVSPLLTLKKVAFDQFVYSAFLACPLMALAFHWQNSGYRSSALRVLFTPAFIGGEVAPLVVSNWCFWIPTTAMIYSLPVPLQLPLFLLAVTIWTLLLVSISTRKRHAPPGIDIPLPA